LTVGIVNTGERDARAGLKEQLETARGSFLSHVTCLGSLRTFGIGSFLLRSSSSVKMIESLAPFRRKLFVLAVCVLLPGSAAFLWARHHNNSSISLTRSLNIEGLQIRQATIDVGTVWSSGQSIHREFVIENNTGHSIRINSVESDCGCTVPTAPSSDVPNGQSAKISVVFWPPAAANDHGGEFQRIISVHVSTTNGVEAVPLSLTGFLAPDASLRVSPASVDVDESALTAGPVAELHFKGSARLLANIPDTLNVTPGSAQRIFVQQPRFDRTEPIATKDVKVLISRSELPSECEDWESAIEFAPDPSSDGLIVRVRGRSPHPLVASPQSLVLSDDPGGREGIVHLTGRIESKLISAEIENNLPLTCDILPETAGGDNMRSMRLRVKNTLLTDVVGTIQVRSGNQTSLGVGSETISIPVVILHRSGTSQK
jgi:hypothetical protein